MFLCTSCSSVGRNGYKSSSLSFLGTSENLCLNVKLAQMRLCTTDSEPASACIHVRPSIIHNIPVPVLAGCVFASQAFAGLFLSPQWSRQFFQSLNQHLSERRCQVNTSANSWRTVTERERSSFSFLRLDFKEASSITHPTGIKQSYSHPEKKTYICFLLTEWSKRGKIRFGLVTREQSV